VSKASTATKAVTKPARISISYAALVALITEAVLFVQDVFVHHTWTERDTLFVIAVAVGFITLVGPFLPVPVSFDSQDGPATDAVVEYSTLKPLNSQDAPSLSPLAPVPTEPVAGGTAPTHDAANPWLPAQ